MFTTTSSGDTLLYNARAAIFYGLESQSEYSRYFTWLELHVKQQLQKNKVAYLP